MKEIDILTAFLAGLVTFFTPCIFPIIPVFLAFVVGLATGNIANKRTFSTSLEILSFILGVSSIFVLLGFGAGSLGSLFIRHRELIKYIGGLFAILLGVQFLVDRYIINLGFKGGLKAGKRRIPILGSFLIGFSFGLSWSPCIGPVLATILVYAASSGSGLAGGILLLAYSLGFCIPLFLTGLVLEKAFELFSKLTPYLALVRVFSGIAFISVGLYIILA